MRRFSLLARLLVLALLPVLSATEAEAASQQLADNGGPARVLVFVEGESRQSLQAAEQAGDVVQELAQAVVLRADGARRAALRADGYRVEVLPDPHQVMLRAGSVDLRQLPLTRALAPRGREAVPLLVVFEGVPVASWVEGLKEAGATVVGPIPPAAILVTADAATLARIQGQEAVLQVAPFLPEWKVDPRLQAGPARTAARLVTFPGSSASRVLALASELGVGLVGSQAFDRTLLMGTFSAAEAAQLAQLPEVERIEIVGHGGFFNNQTRVVMQTDKAHYLANQAFYNPIYAIGVWGASQVVTLADSGINPPPQRHEVFDGPGKVISNLPAQGSCVVMVGDAAYGGLGHGTGVANTLLGDKIGALSGGYGSANDLDGLSLRSNLRMQDIENSFENFCPPFPYYRNLFFPAWQAGSMIHNDSWGHNGSRGDPPGSYTMETYFTDAYLKDWNFREQVIVFAAGNKGYENSSYTPFSLSDEAHGKNVITVGGSENGNARNQMYIDSSRGPTSDCNGGPCGPNGRVKPDIVAPARVETADGRETWAYAGFPGTSVAAPAISGAAALVRDYFAQGKYPNDPTDPPLLLPPSSALVKAMLVNATVFLTDKSAWQANSIFSLPANAYPNFDQGYGRPVLDNVLEPAGYRELKVWEDGSTWATSGSVWTRQPRIQERWKASCNILRITLAWTDEPMTLGAGRALVNDLDLEVTFNNQIYRGNHFLTGNQFDQFNNVEDVYIPMGNVNVPYLFPVIKVYGRTVTTVQPQPFAVVMTYGTCPDTIPCPPLPPKGGDCYRGPQDVVPGWKGSVPGCADQIYGKGEYQGNGTVYPRCAQPPSDPGNPVPVPVPPVGPDPQPRGGL